MGLHLHLYATPDHLRLDGACDLDLRLRLSTDERLTIYPAAAKLGAIASYAGIGITWGFSLRGPAGDVPIQELRTWYGPPGNPPSPEWAKRDAIVLAPGTHHEVAMPACWVPNSELDPASLDPQQLDPQGMDNIRPRDASSVMWPTPALSERVDLARCSAIVFAPLQALQRSKVDFLRGHVVAFVPAPGEYELVASYSQASFMGVGDNASAVAPPARFTIG